MLTNKIKFIIRWAAISFVFIGYYLWLIVASFSYSHISEKESVLLSGPVSIEYHRAIIESINDATDIVFKASAIGFFVCVTLILIFFKKVR
jgi:hypothetical protein